MTAQKCSRCGKKTAQAKTIPLSGTSRGAMVCPDCYVYLTESDVAYERFVLLERAKKQLWEKRKSKKKEAMEDFEMTNKQGRPSSWTEEEVEALIKMRTEDVSITEIAQKLGRSEGAVSGKLWQLRDQGRLPNKKPSAGTEENGQSGTPVPTNENGSSGRPVPTNAAASTEEKGTLNPLEQEMADLIKKQKAEIDELKRENERLETQVTEQKVEIERLERENDGLLDKGIELHNHASDLERELRDTKNALAETERQFDEYRETEEGSTAIVEKYEKALMKSSVEVGELRDELSRVRNIALGVVEKFALGEAV